MNNRVNEQVLNPDGSSRRDIPVQPALRGPEGVNVLIHEIRKRVEQGERLPMNAAFILGTRIMGVCHTMGEKGSSREITKMFANVAGLVTACGDNEKYVGIVSELRDGMLLAENQRRKKVQEGMKLVQ